MRVLITGGGGFIGRHLVASQLAQGHHVRVLDLHAAPFEVTAGCSPPEFIPGSVTEAHLVAKAVEGVDVVYHLASTHLGVNTPAAEYRRVNVYATLNLLSLANAAGVKRFVHCSSNAVVGEIQHPPVDETVTCRPTNIYEQTKWAGEQLALHYWRETGFPVAIVRPAWVYGPGCPRTARLFRMVKKGRFIMFGNGSTLRHPLHITDAVHGLELCARTEGIAGQVYFIAGPRAVTLETLVREIGKVAQVRPRIIHVPIWIGKVAGQSLEWSFARVNRQPPFSRRSMDFFLKHNAYRLDKAKRDLGFEPQVDLRSGLQAMYQYLNRQEHGKPTGAHNGSSAGSKS